MILIRLLISIVALFFCLISYDLFLVIYDFYFDIYNKSESIAFFFMLSVFLFFPVYFTYQFLKSRVRKFILIILTVSYIMYEYIEIYPKRIFVVALCFFLGLLITNALIVISNHVSKKNIS